MATEHYFQARAAAGRAAISIAHTNEAVGADLIRGAADGFLLASAALVGWDAVLAHVKTLATADRVPAEIQKPSLKVVRGGIA